MVQNLKQKTQKPAKCCCAKKHVKIMMVPASWIHLLRFLAVFSTKNDLKICPLEWGILS